MCREFRKIVFLWQYGLGNHAGWLTDAVDNPVRNQALWYIGLAGGPGR